MPCLETIHISPLSHHLPRIVTINFHHSLTAILTPLPFRHQIAPGVACGSLPGGRGCLRYDLRGLQRLLRLPRGDAGHGKRRGTTRAAPGEEAHLYVGHVDATDATGDGGWWMVDE